MTCSKIFETQPFVYKIINYGIMEIVLNIN